MPPAPSSTEPLVDIVVSGAGASGLAAAITLAKAGFSVVCIGKSEAPANGRTVALFEGSLRFLREIGIWDRFDAASQRIKAIRLVDDTGLRLPVVPLTLAADEIGLEALGANVENDRLIAGLLAEAATLPTLTLTGTFVSTIAFEDDHARVVDTAGRVMRARLIVAADGRRSPARIAAGIGARTWTYRQEAMTVFVAHRRPHDGVSIEFHTRAGPCTLVPLPPTAAHPHRSSLVWLMTPRDAERRRHLDDDAFARELQRQTRSVLGHMSLDGARGAFPMGGLRVNRLVAPRIALMGEAAHAFPPLAAQGLNLSLRDIAQLRSTLEEARRRGRDIGDVEVLRLYEKARRRDIALRTSGVDVLNRSIMTDFTPVDAARGLGALALRAIGPLRRAVLREGILPPGPVTPAIPAP